MRFARIRHIKQSNMTFLKLINSAVRVEKKGDEVEIALLQKITVAMAAAVADAGFRLVRTDPVRDGHLFVYTLKKNK